MSLLDICFVHCLAILNELLEIIFKDRFEMQSTWILTWNRWLVTDRRRWWWWNRLGTGGALHLTRVDHHRFHLELVFGDVVYNDRQQIEPELTSIKLQLTPVVSIIKGLLTLLTRRTFITIWSLTCVGGDESTVDGIGHCHFSLLSILSMVHKGIITEQFMHLLQRLDDLI